MSQPHEALLRHPRATIRCVATVSSETSLASGYEALAAGSWEAARDAFQEAVDATDAPEALDGLGRALWWFRNTRDAVVYRERAYAGFRRDGELARAARIALWLSREYALVFAKRRGREWLAGAGLAPPSRCRAPAPSAGGSHSLALRGHAIRASRHVSPRRHSQSRKRPATQISSCGHSPSSASPRGHFSVVETLHCEHELVVLRS